MLPDVRRVNMAAQVKTSGLQKDAFQILVSLVWKECRLRDWKMNLRNNFGGIFSLALRAEPLNS